MGIVTVAVGIAFKDFKFIMDPFDWAIGNRRMVNGIGNIKLEFLKGSKSLLNPGASGWLGT